MSYLDTYFERLTPNLCLAIALFLVLVLGVMDYYVGPELSFSVFYTAPIMFGAWYGGRKVGWVVAVVSACTWLIADILSGLTFTTIVVPLWNTFVRLLFFVIILYLLLIVRSKLEFESSLADTDPLTGLANRRYFHEQLERELNRVQRYPGPFTLAFIDLDNFKRVNDTMGHDAGDELLKEVATVLVDYTRASDLTARLGGDEFALLFPSLEKGSAEQTLRKLREQLLLKMKEGQWPVTFSIGAVTFDQPMIDIRSMMKCVDDEMYRVKKMSKNNVRHAVWP